MFGTILLAVDGSQYAERAVELTRRLAAGSGDEVVVLHVTQIMPVRGGQAVELQGDRDAIELAGRYAKELEAAGVAARVELDRAMAGHVARSIVEAAQQHHAGLIVMGSHGRGDVVALLLGSVAHKVLHLADRPVLIAR